MPSIVIDNLVGGMNLRDPAATVAKGETGISIGADHSVPGIVRPMRTPLLRHTLPADIVDAVDTYLQGIKYRFTTHADGLRVSQKVADFNWLTPILIDANFKGTFKLLPINDEYVVLSNGTYKKKWKPGWAGTYQWGLNTPPVPTITGGTGPWYEFDDFEDISGWVLSGGGVSAAKAGDSINYLDGHQSMKLSLDGNTTLTATKPVTLDLSGHNDAYLDLPYLLPNTYSIQTLTVYFSVAADGGFNHEYYWWNFTPVYSFTTITGTHKTGFPASDFLVDSSGRDLAALGALTGQIIKNVTQNKSAVITAIGDEDATNDKVEGTLTGSAKWAEGDSFQIYVSSVGTWVNPNSVPLSDFQRVGTDTTRDWSTVTAIKIEVTAFLADTYIEFDRWRVYRATVTGTYRAAVSYQNELGNYGPYSAYCDAVDITSASLTIGNLVPDTDPQTTARRIAIISSNITDPWVVTLGNNSATTMTYSEGVTPLEEVELYFNNDKPPAFVDMIDFNGRIFGVIGDEKGYYSNELFFEAFPAANNLVLGEGEKLFQVDNPDQNYIAWRGKGKEYLTQLTTGGPAYWQTVKGADAGAISPRLLLKDPGGGRVYASQLGIYISGSSARGYYLPKLPFTINDPSQPFGITDFSMVFGAMIPDRAYLYLQDKDGVDWVLRIDYRLGTMIPHFVMSEKPNTIWSDQILERVYFSDGAEVLEFDAGTGPLPVTLTIPEQMGEDAGPKDFIGLDHELEGNPIDFSLTLDRQALSGTYVLPVAMRMTEPVSLPWGTVGNQLGLTLTAADEFQLYLPLLIVYETQDK